MSKAGALHRLAREREVLAAPGPGEARVAVGAVGLNFADVFACLGLYSATPTGPFVPGLEFAGVVEEIGPAVPAPAGEATRAVRVGDRVIGLTRFGACATALNVDARYLQPCPPAWSLSEAAAFPVQAITAWYGLREQGRLAPGDAVLVQSAAGGVGLHALAIVGASGGRVVAAVGGESKKTFLVEQRGLRPEQVVVRNRRRFGAQLDAALRAAGLDGFDIVFDAVAGPFLRPAYDRLVRGGRLVVFGAADMMPAGGRPNYLRLAWQYLRRPRLDPLQMISDNRAVIGFNLIWMWDHAARLPAAYDALFAVAVAPPVIGRRYGFDAAPEALRFLQRGGNVGKVILEVPGGGRAERAAGGHEARP